MVEKFMQKVSALLNSLARKLAVLAAGAGQIKAFFKNLLKQLKGE